MDEFLQDLRYAARGLFRAPGFTAASVATLALGIAATTVIFTLINAFLLRPLPVHEPDRLVTVEEIRRGGRVSQQMGQWATPYERYRDIREATGSLFSGLVAQRQGNHSVRIDGPARIVTGVVVSGNYFDVLGIRPAMGRFFSDDEATAPVVVVSHRLWRDQLGSDPGAVGRTIHLDGRPLEVIGVAPPGFGGTLVGLVAEVWAPIEGYEAAAPEAATSSRPWVLTFARLQPGMQASQAAAAVETVARQLPAENPASEFVDVRLTQLSGIPVSLRTPLMGFMAMLMATAGLVLLIASINVGGLLLARATARRREVAVRLAVGSGRGRVVRLFLTESMLLFLVGGAVGVLLAVWLVALLAAIPLPVQVPLVLDLGVDGTVLTFALGLALLTGLVFGLIPALQSSRPDVLPALKDGEGGRGTARSRLRSAFVVVQLAVSLLLLVAAGLFGRTLQNALAVETGFDPDNVVVGRIDLGAHGYAEEGGRAFYDRLLERLESRPEIVAVGMAVYPPMSGNVNRTMVVPMDDGGGRPDSDAGIAVDYQMVDEEYFETLRVPLLAGRTFTAADRAGAPPVLIVNQTLAERVWPGQSPLGRRLAMGDEEREVVGVVAAGKYESYRDEDVVFMYFPFGQRYSGTMTVHARARAEPGAAIRAMRLELAALDPDIALEDAEPLSNTMAFFLFPQRMAGGLIGVFGLLGLLLAAIGIYGILAYHVAQRTREIGIRMALGARRPDVVRLVVRGGLTLVSIGLAVGLAAAFAATRLLQSLLYGVTPTDPMTFIGVPLLLVLVALLASYLPARRATRVDPMVALRYE